MKIRAEEIHQENFQPYGIFLDLYGDPEWIKHYTGDGFVDHMTRNPLIDTPAHLGLTVGSAAPCAIRFMEKHSHTQEAILCASDPVILCVATARGDEPPRGEDVRAFRICPGQAVILERNVWHDACHGVHGPAAYYWLASAGESLAAWIEVAGSPELEC